MKENKEPGSLDAKMLIGIVETAIGTYIRQFFGDFTKISVGEDKESIVVNIKIDKALIAGKLFGMAGRVKK